MAENTVKVEEGMVETEVYTKTSIKDRILQSKPVKAVREHPKRAVAAGVGVATAIAAVVLGKKAIDDGTIEVPFGAGTVADAIPVDIAE